MSDPRQEKEPLVLIGGGGHCKACIDVIEAAGNWNILGILDLAERVGENVLGYPIIGTDERIRPFASSGVRFLVSIGQIMAVEPRRSAFELVKSSNGKFATIISPSAYVSPSAALGAGTIVMHRAVVNASAVIGDNVIINTQALIEHDAMVGNHCHISTAAVVNGGATVGSSSFVGSNAVIVHGAVMPNDAFIPAGTLFRRQEE